MKALTKHFKRFSLEHVSRSEKKCVDALSKLTSSIFPHLTKNIFVEIVQTKATEGNSVMSIIEDTNDWRNPIVEYLTEGKLPSDDKQARKLRVKAPPFVWTT